MPTAPKSTPPPARPASGYRTVTKFKCALYEQRIRRSVEKNEKQLKELQAERQAAYEKVLEEEKLLAMLAPAEGEVYETEANGFGFSAPQKRCTGV